MNPKKETTENVPGYISQKISIKENLFFTFRILRKINFSFVNVAILSIISAVAELLGVIIIFTYVYSFLGQSNDIVSKNWNFIFQIINKITDGNIFIFSCIIAITVIGKSIIGILTNYYSARECYSAQEKIAVKLTRRFINDHDSKNQEISVGDAVNRIFNENERFINAGILVMVKLWAEIVTTLSLVILLLFSDTAATVTLITVFFVISIIYLFWTNSVMTTLGISIAKHTARLIGSITNIVLGIDEIKQLDKSGFFLNRVQATAVGFKNINSLRVALSFLSRYFIEFGLILFLIILTLLNEFAYASQFFNIGIGSLALFGVVGLRLLPAVNTMVTSINSLVWSSNSTALIYPYIINEDEFYSLEKKNEYLKNIEDYNVNNRGGLVLEVKGGVIEYVSLKPILNDINIAIKIGNIISVIGNSGSGKSSLGKMLAGLMPLKSGNIFIGNKKIDNSNELMSIFHYVPQKPFVFEGSIYENITFQEIDNADDLIKHNVETCLYNAGLKDSRWKDLSYKIYDGGKNLSGGEAQRIALARALYYKKPFIVLDEFTSSLDEKTELQVLDQIKELSKDHCFVIITHRKSAIPYSDKIVEVKSGFVDIRSN